MENNSLKQLWYPTWFIYASQNATEVMNEAVITTEKKRCTTHGVILKACIATGNNFIPCCILVLTLCTFTLYIFSK